MDGGRGSWRARGLEEELAEPRGVRERALRRVALGRKNYLFVHDVERGASIAGLYSLVATCEARGINPFEYLADVLARVQDHPIRAIDELLLMVKRRAARAGAWLTARTGT